MHTTTIDSIIYLRAEFQDINYHFLLNDNAISTPLKRPSTEWLLISMINMDPKGHIRSSESQAL